MNTLYEYKKMLLLFPSVQLLNLEWIVLQVNCKTPLPWLCRGVFGSNTPRLNIILKVYANYLNYIRYILDTI